MHHGGIDIGHGGAGLQLGVDDAVPPTKADSVRRVAPSRLPTCTAAADKPHGDYEPRIRCPSAAMTQAPKIMTPSPSTIVFKRLGRPTACPCSMMIGAF